MSISIGSSLTNLKVLTINSDNSNVINLDSSTSNILINVGEFTFGQSFNSSNVKALNITKGTEQIVTFNDSSIIMHKNVTFASDSSSAEISTNAVLIDNNQSNQAFISATSNDIKLLEATTEYDGTLYVGGHIGIGVSVPDTSYSIYADSNIYTNTSIQSATVQTGTLFTDIIEFSGVNDPSLKGSSNIIAITPNRIVLDFDEVVIRNQRIEDFTTFIDIRVTNTAQFDKATVACNMTFCNIDDASRTPFRVVQSLTNGQISNYLGNPITVISQMPSTPENFDEILQLSSYGHLILGGNVRDTVNTIDYLLRGSLSENRSSNFEGFVHFSTSNQGVENTAFVVNKEGHLAIGNPASTSVLELNSFVSETYSPTSMMTLSNVLDIPLMQAYSGTSVIQLTSNATLCFTDAPMDTTKYDIESTKTSYLSNIETSSILGIGSIPINLNYSDMSNIRDISTSNLSSMTAFIDTLRVNNFSTTGGTDTGVYTITNDQYLFTGNAYAIHPSAGYFSSDEYLLNIASLSNSLIIYTNGTPEESVHGISIIGDNTAINMLSHNTQDDGIISYEMKVSSERFKMGVKHFASTSEALLFITPNEYDIDNAISIFNNKMVRFGGQTHIYPNGIMYLGYNASEALEQTDVTTRMFIGGGIEVNGTLTVKNNASIGSGTNSVLGGPYMKQYGWINMTNGVYAIPYNNYGGGTDCSGTLNIQVKTNTGRMGNIVVSFIKESSAPEVDIFIVSLHKSNFLQTLAISTNLTEIVVSTDDLSSIISWTVVGSC